MAGKKARAAAERKGEAPVNGTSIANDLLWPAGVTLLLAGVRQSTMLQSAAEGRCYFLVRFVLFMMLQELYVRAVRRLLMPPVRLLARRLPGAVSREISAKDNDGLRAAEKVVSMTAEMAEDHERHDPTLKWPCPGTILPPEWTAVARGKQPYFLNHVRGSTRLLQAGVRVSAALGTVLQVCAMAWLVDERPVGAIGLWLSWVDLGLGFLTGVSVIVALFAAEVCLGWLRVVGYCEVVAPGEWLHLNLLWDVIFHVAVSIHEEVSHRGWLLVNTAHACKDHLGISAAHAVGLSAALHSLHSYIPSSPTVHPYR